MTISVATVTISVATRLFVMSQSGWRELSRLSVDVRARTVAILQARIPRRDPNGGEV